MAVLKTKEISSDQVESTHAHQSRVCKSVIQNSNKNVFETQIKHKDTFDVSQRLFLILSLKNLNLNTLANGSLHFSNKP